MSQQVLIRRTPTDNNPPAPGSLQPGELAVEMGVPTRLWVGVPVAVDPDEQKLLIDTSATSGGVSISDTPPANPRVGQIWWNSANGDTNIWYDDGTSQQWVQVAPGVTSAALEFQQSGVGAVETTVQEKLREVLSLEDFGAGLSNDDTVAIRNAITEASARGPGTAIKIASKRYNISDTITINVPIVLDGDFGGFGGATFINTAAPALVWISGSGAKPMVKFTSGVSGQAIVGGGVRGLLLDGNNEATVGLELDGVSRGVHSVAAFRCTAAGVNITDVNDFGSDGTRFTSLEYYCGPDAACAGSSGLVMNGDYALATTIKNVQVDFLRAEVKNGTCVSFRTTEACNVERLDATIQAGGTGYAVAFITSTNYGDVAPADGIQDFNTQRNRVGLLTGNAKVFFGNYVKNNVIERILATTGSWTITATAARRANHIGSIIDYGNDGNWKTHEFKFMDAPVVPLAYFGASAAFPGAILGPVPGLGTGQAWEFPASGDTEIVALMPCPPEWHNGSIMGFRMSMMTNTAVAGLFGAMNFAAKGFAPGDALVAPTVFRELNFAIPATANTVFRQDLTFLTTNEAPVFFKGMLLMRLRRIVSNSGDNYTGSIFVTGIQPVFSASGPASPGNGPFARIPFGGDDLNP